MIQFRKILLVDDDSVCNLLTQEIILDMNITNTISVATNGEEALRYFQGTHNEVEYDLILLDLLMPTMDGLEFLDKVNAEYSELRKKIKIVILTSSSAGQDIENLRKRKIDGFIVKPLTEKKLFEIIKML